jgi:hypothetical protein
MTNIVLTFPLRRTAHLRCVWIATGNPAQPLVCKWTTDEKSGSDRTVALAEAPASAPLHCMLCA